MDKTQFTPQRFHEVGKFLQDAIQYAKEHLNSKDKNESELSRSIIGAICLSMDIVLPQLDEVIEMMEDNPADPQSQAMAELTAMALGIKNEHSS